LFYASAKRPDCQWLIGWKEIARDLRNVEDGGVNWAFAVARGDPARGRSEGEQTKSGRFWYWWCMEKNRSAVGGERVGLPAAVAAVCDRRGMEGLGGLRRILGLNRDSPAEATSFDPLFLIGSHPGPDQVADSTASEEFGYWCPIRLDPAANMAAVAVVR